MTPRESEIQADVRRLFERLGCWVYVLSSYRKGATGIAPGLPDLLVMCERKGLQWWWETKTPDGRVSEAQAQFAERCRRARVPYGRGGLQEAYQFVWKLGLAAMPSPLAESRWP